MEKTVALCKVDPLYYLPLTYIVKLDMISVSI